LIAMQTWKLRKYIASTLAADREAEFELVTPSKSSMIHNDTCCILPFDLLN
jgi:hypothetical protein